jgi:acetate kinase
MPKERNHAIRDASPRGIIRYGFHGISVSTGAPGARRRGRERSRNRRSPGNGASGAVRDSRCVDTTIGFTPPRSMSTRTGDIDPGILLYLAGEKGLTC